LFYLSKEKRKVEKRRSGELSAMEKGDPSIKAGGKQDPAKRISSSPTRIKKKMEWGNKV